MFHAGGGFIVTFVRIEGLDQSIRATTVSAAGVVGAEITSSADDGSGACVRKPDSTLTERSGRDRLVSNHGKPDLEFSPIDTDRTPGFSVNTIVDGIPGSRPRRLEVSS